MITIGVRCDSHLIELLDLGSAPPLADYDLAPALCVVNPASTSAFSDCACTFSVQPLRSDRAVPDQYLN